MRNSSWHPSKCGRFTFAIWAAGTILLLQTTCKGKENTKAVSQQIEKANRELAQFAKSKELDHLQGAIEAMEGVDFSGSQKGSARIQARQETTKTWLSIVAAIDRQLDPHFDPNDVPAANIIPPKSGRVQLPSGVDPQAIPDPAVRAEYEAALEKNKEKAEQYLVQTRLRRMDLRVSSDVNRFFGSCYTSSPIDQREIEDILQKAALSTSRKQRIRVLFDKN